MTWPPEITMHLGHLSGRTEAIVAHLGRIDRRLEHGDSRMDGLQDDAHGLTRAVDRIEAKLGAIADVQRSVEALSADLTAVKGRKPDVSTVERVTKEVLRFAVPFGVLWWTGSIEAALKLAGALK